MASLPYHDSLLDKEKSSHVLINGSSVTTKQALSRSKLDRAGMLLESLEPVGKGLSVLESQNVGLAWRDSFERPRRNDILDSYLFINMAQREQESTVDSVTIGKQPSPILI